MDSLTGAGFTIEGAQWMTTNLKPAKDGNKGELDWVFDLDGIKDMYSSYEATNLWPMLETHTERFRGRFRSSGTVGVRLGRGRREQIIKHGSENTLLGK